MKPPITHSPPLSKVCTESTMLPWVFWNFLVSWSEAPDGVSMPKQDESWPEPWPLFRSGREEQIHGSLCVKRHRESYAGVALHVGQQGRGLDVVADEVVIDQEHLAAPTQFEQAIQFTGQLLRKFWCAACVRKE